MGLGSKLDYAPVQELRKGHAPQRSDLGLGFVRKARTVFSRVLDLIEANIEAEVGQPLERYGPDGESAINDSGSRRSRP